MLPKNKRFVKEEPKISVHAADNGHISLLEFYCGTFA